MKYERKEQLAFYPFFCKFDKTMSEKIDIQCQGTLLDENELSAEYQQLLGHTRLLYANAYAPYSRFHVAAIALLEDGTEVKGTNQENAAYPSGLCAERVTLFHAGAVYPGKRIKVLCISASSEDKEVNKPVAPCGSCLQVISESEFRQDSPITILLSGASGKVLMVEGVKNLLPFRFLPDEL